MQVLAAAALICAAAAFVSARQVNLVSASTEWDYQAVRVAEPITRDDAADMIGELRHAAYLESFRGLPKADVPALVDLMVRLSEFVGAHPEIEEVELNPVWVGPEGEGAYALDALVLAAPQK